MEVDDADGAKAADAYVITEPVANVAAVETVEVAVVQADSDNALLADIALLRGGETHGR